MSVDRVPPSLLISVGVHVVLGIVWSVVPGPDRPEPEEAPPLTPEIELVDPPAAAEPPAAPVDVVMLDAAALARIPALATEPKPAPEPTRKPPPEPIAKATRTPTEPARPAPPAREIARSTVEPRPETVAPPTTTEPSPWLSMRKGRDPEGRGRDALLVTPSLEKIAIGGAGAVEHSIVETRGGAIAAKPRESVVTAQITPDGGGSYKVDDLVFKGRIAPDGGVTLKDKPNIQHQFKSWSHVKKVLREAGPLGLLKLDFDITDAVMRKHKADPYASRKLAFLDQTRDARVEIGRQYRKEVLAKTSQIVRDNLEVMWAATPAPAARKQALFEMWDEVDEAGEEDVVEAGKAARASIIGFIQARLPRTGADAFTASELSAFNTRRRSKSTFAPYD